MNSPTSNLKVLLVGINKYPVFPLKGCINDLNAIHQFLKKQCNTSKTKLDVKILCDEEATYENFIHVFLEHFSTLKDNDQALLYYVGHGSQMNAPKEFWHNTPNKKLETIVLHDSRLKGGWDLTRKELSYLIWKVTEKKEVFFTTIADCCYSGEITRNRESNSRRHESSHKSRTWKDFYGAHEYYEKNDNVIVPVGKQILLAACRKEEEAKERYIDSEYRGVFTYSLLKVLEETKGRLTYQELIRLTQLEVYNQTNKQHPQYFSTNKKRNNQYFLGNTLKERANSHVLFYNKQLQDGLPIGWLIDQGLIDGIEETNVRLMVFENSNLDILEPHMAIAEVELDQVLATHSVVQNTQKLSIESQYQAVFLTSPFKTLKIAYHPECDPIGLTYLDQEMKSSPSLYLKLVDDWKEAQFLIYTNTINNKNSFGIRRVGESSNPFQQIDGYNQATANQLFKNLETIARWFRIKNTKSFMSMPELKQLEFEFHIVNQATPNLMEVVERTAIKDFLINEPTLEYNLTLQNQIGEEIDPMFQLKIKCPLFLKEGLWFSTLYLGSDFSISNELMPLSFLKPGEEKNLEYYDKEQGLTTNLIPLHIEDAYLKNGIFEITEHFKIIISTHEFDSHKFNQNGIPFEFLEEDNHRGRGRKARIGITPQARWSSVDFAIRVKYPNTNKPLE